MTMNTIDADANACIISNTSIKNIINGNCGASRNRHWNGNSGNRGIDNHEFGNDRNQRCCIEILSQKENVMVGHPIIKRGVEVRLHMLMGKYYLCIVFAQIFLCPVDSIHCTIMESWDECIWIIFSFQFYYNIFNLFMLLISRILFHNNNLTTIPITFVIINIACISFNWLSF